MIRLFHVLPSQTNNVSCLSLKHHFSFSTHWRPPFNRCKHLSLPSKLMITTTPGPAYAGASTMISNRAKNCSLSSQSTRASRCTCKPDSSRSTQHAPRSRWLGDSGYRRPMRRRMWMTERYADVLLLGLGTHGMKNIERVTEKTYCRAPWMGFRRVIRRLHYRCNLAR